MSTRIDSTVEREVVEGLSDDQTFKEALNERLPVDTEGLARETRERYDERLSPSELRRYLDTVTVEDHVDLAKIDRPHRLAERPVDELRDRATDYRYDPYNARVYALKTLEAGYYPPIVLDDSRTIDGVHRILALSELGASTLLCYVPNDHK